MTQQANFPDSYPSSRFWDLVHNASQDPDRIEEQFKTMSRDDLTWFYYEYNDAIADLTSVARGKNREDDAQLDIAAAWVIAHGKHYYLAVLANPQLFPNPNTVASLNYAGVAAGVYWDQFHESLI